ncbi:MAG TPA: exodeoxyribonuclease V subunit gamma, partial [Spirochaetota bacterium]|nr:exodeoxyribonuclease V subunit gamma [Spirochaetota bacterium]
MPFRLYQSNDLAALARRFRDTLRDNPLPPMEKEIVLVQSIGMGRWISLFMAEAFGAWANFKYIYPNVFLDTAFRAAFEGYDPGKLISKDEMRWLIHSALPSLTADKVYAPLGGYAGDENELKRFQLAGKIADLFDQYLTSRPEMIRAWDDKRDTLIAGDFSRDLADDEKWQSALWRKITAKRKTGHRAYLREQLALKGFPLFSADKLPERLSVFGVSTLFPFHLDILEALSSHVEVTMYVLSPSREYIADIMPAKLRARTARRLAAKGVTQADAHIDRGNVLVGSLGALARDFQNTLLSRAIDDLTSDDDFRDPGDGTLLGAIQSDILNLRDRRNRIMIDPEDESIRIASCYGPRREVEALHDYLMHLLNEHASGATGDDTLNPRDILVMTVDIDTYAPYIESVFGSKKTEDNGACFIPYSIADRNIRAQSALSRGFEKIFSLSHKGFAASA